METPTILSGRVGDLITQVPQIKHEATPKGPMDTVLVIMNTQRSAITTEATGSKILRVVYKQRGIRTNLGYQTM